MGIFYGSSSGKTADIASRIREKIGPGRADVRDVGVSSPGMLLGYELLILGIPTWGIGRVQEDWERFMHRLEDLDLSGKTVALFGLGDQESYPENFADALGKLHGVLIRTGCGFSGSWPLEGYSFKRSAAVKGGRFVGLVLDEENQPHLTDGRLDRWLEEIFSGTPKQTVCHGR